MTKAKTAKYPTLRVRVSQDMYDKAYRTGWPSSVKEFINNIKEKTNDKKTKPSAVTANK
jgi:hypothetical protein